MAGIDGEMPKMLRVFKLIELLSGPVRHTTLKLAQRLGVSRKTVERYYRLLEGLGYLIDKDPITHRYFIQVEQGLEDTFDFEEAAYLNDTLRLLPDDNAIRNALLLKVNQQYRLLPVLQTLHRNAHYARLRDLQRAADEKRVVKLHNYLGGQGKVSTRRIAITGFTEGNRGVYARDLDIDQDRQFMLDRMSLVEVTEVIIEQNYTFYPNDLFGWPGKDWLQIRLRLSNRARQLLLEELPAAAGFLSMNREGITVGDFRVRGFEGLGRWVLGLPREVEVLEGGDGLDFRTYLNERARDW